MDLDLAFGPWELRFKNHPADKTTVVIDVLRSTTTMITACQNGCSSIRPVLTPEEAFQKARRFPPHAIVLGGERGGRKIEGFHLGNSPGEYAEERVKNKHIIFTSTNCTKTLLSLNASGRILICSFLNVSAVARQLAREQSDVLIACAGNRDLFSLEDTCCAGVLVSRLAQRLGNGLRAHDSARAAEILFDHYKNDLLGMLRQSEWGQRIARLGLAHDLSLCARVDESTVIPEMIGERIILPTSA